MALRSDVTSSQSTRAAGSRTRRCSPLPSASVVPAPTVPADVAALGTSPSGSRTYVGRNAGYTYPDLNNFYLASISPATGEVLVPSFHRAWLFNMGNYIQSLKNRGD